MFQKKCNKFSSKLLHKGVGFERKGIDLWGFFFPSFIVSVLELDKLLLSSMKQYWLNVERSIYATQKG